MHAHILDGAVADYPYHLRATDGGDPARCAKRLYPGAFPLPGSWELCSPEQLAAVNAVPVVAVERPAGAREITPTLVDGVWTQTWAAPPAYDPITEIIRWNGTQWVVEARLPGAVSRYQIRRALRALNRLTVFNNYITSLPADSPVREKWEQGAQSFTFGKAWCIATRDGLGLTNAQILALWRAAEAIEEDD